MKLTKLWNMTVKFLSHYKIHGNESVAMEKTIIYDFVEKNSYQKNNTFLTTSFVCWYENTDLNKRLTFTRSLDRYDFIRNKCCHVIIFIKGTSRIGVYCSVHGNSRSGQRTHFLLNVHISTVCRSLNVFTAE